jgi:hypothetical protein
VSGGGGGGGSLNRIHKLKSAVHVVTNDEMRDHYFCMPSATVSVAEVQSFMRWKERHQVHFDFGMFNKQHQSKEVFIFKPTTFSIRMQFATEETMKMNNDVDDTGNTTTYSTSSPSATSSSISLNDMKINNEAGAASSNSSSSQLIEKDKDNKDSKRTSSSSSNKIIAWHVPCWKIDPSTKGFIGHDYSNADEFTNISKPVK